MDIYTLGDIIEALQSAQPGEELLFNIKNNIIFTNSVLMNQRITINLTNGSGNENVTLAIAEGGTFRHLSTGGASIDNVTINVGPGIIFDGGGTGGGIQIFGSSCLLALNGCLIINCLSSLNGGGVLIQGNASRSRLVMTNTIIEGCQAGSGAGVFASACEVEMNGGEIRGNRANSSGGGITTLLGANRLGSTLTINGGRIINNSVTFNDGGGINAFDTIVTIDGSEISNNAADINGGGIYSLNQSGDAQLNALMIRNSMIRGNTVRNFGAGIRAENPLGEFTITNCTITENKAVSTQVGSNQGGGVYYSGAALVMRDTIVSANEAGTSGGGIFANFSTLIVGGTTEIRDNEAAITAGGIYGFQGCTVTIEENTKIINNHAHCGNDPENASRGGGGIALLSFGFVSTLTVRGAALIGRNTSVSYGGGIWTYPTFGPETIVNIEDGTIEGNTANYGGGISMGEIPGYTPVLTITGGAITNNTALKDGGGIIAKGSLVTVSGSEITNNTAGRDGGGIFTDQLANVTVYADAAFSGNTAERYAFWQITSGGDSDIHKTHILTNRFSTFIPVQSPPPEIWSFTNAYNNYDINYVRPVETVTVRFNYTSALTLEHETIIDSFLGATVVIPPRETFIDENGTVWALQPPGQPAQTLMLTNPEANYAVTFYFVPAAAAAVTVSEDYVDISGCQIIGPTQTIVEFGGNYRKTAPDIMGYAFVGYRINNGSLQAGEVNIIGINTDTVVTFIYTRNCNCSCRCNPHPYKRSCFQPCYTHQLNILHRFGIGMVQDRSRQNGNVV